ncbi:MAG: nickel pincer cofactor biosynthesis protein LarC [Nitrospiraceae bacterium]
MKHLHFDCFSGVSGDMILGALVDVGLPLAELARGLKAMKLYGYRLRAGKVRRGGMPATKVEVAIRSGFRAPLPVPRMQRIIASSRLPDRVKERSLEVFQRLAQAEAQAHRMAVFRVHFHEVGVVDSLVDVVGGVLGCHLLGADRITASPVNLGAGTIDCAHGTLPVPGPAVAALAKGLPVYSAGPSRELSTPTGLAVLSVLADDFGPLPLMRLTAIGYGAGTADPDGWTNALRVFVGEPVPSAFGEQDTIVQIETNLDDLNPQVYETVMARLFGAGAVDVTLTPAIMKRGRPGIVLTALAPPQKADAVAGVVLAETTSLGVRMQDLRRRVLARQVVTVRLPGGSVRVKVAAVGGGRTKAAPEYLDCKRIAEQTGRPVRDVMEEAALTYRKAGQKLKVKGTRT